MSSHREAPETSKDPAADNTDVYAFVSPDRPDTTTLIANFNPFQKPDGGPNFYEFADDVRYTIKVSNTPDIEADVAFEFRFTTRVRAESFLYNTGPITKITDSTWNRPQTYTVTKVTRDGHRTELAGGLLVPPVNVGIRTTPDYPALAAQAIHSLPGGAKVFAGPRADPFHVDIGSVFDLAGLRPFNDLHLIKERVMPGVNGLQGLNVSSIVLQVKTTELTRGGYGSTKASDPRSVIGVWATAERQKSRMYDARTGTVSATGPWQQVSRLAFPLFNELLVPMARKDYWNGQAPSGDAQFAARVLHPELVGLLPGLYPGVFPNLAAYKKPRADLAAVILTGIPSGVIPGFQNFTGPRQADVIRLNTAIPPSANPSPLGLVGGDAAGFPNGRRVADDVVAIELRALAGVLIPLVDPTFTPDKAAGGLTDGTSNTNGAYPSTFPYLATPNSGYAYSPGPASTGAQMSGMPIGGAATGGGSTAGTQDTALAVAGAAALAGAGGLLAVRHRAAGRDRLDTPAETSAS